jgi:hypothetical protein
MGRMMSIAYTGMYASYAAARLVHRSLSACAFDFDKIELAV